MNATSVSFHEITTMNAITQAISKNEEMILASSFVTRVRTCSTSCVRRDTI